MPTFTVRLRVNVPGVGDREITLPGIVKPTLEEAIIEAKTNLIVEVIAVTKTG